jgi:CRISPR system Cascade subunit CasB
MTQPEPLAVAHSQESEGGLGFHLYNEVRKLVLSDRRGDIAELRRLDPDQPNAPAFFRIMARVAPEASDHTARRCAHLLRILAIKPEKLSDDRLGRIMADAGVSESRVQRLLTARGEAMRDQLRLIARRLANYGNLPWRGFAQLLLVSEQHADDVRLRVARDYWRALDRAEAQP